MNRFDLLTEVVEAVADADGIEPVDVEPLHNHLNPEVLVALGKSDNGDWSFTFQYTDHQITVTAESQVFIDGRLYKSEKAV